MAEQVADAIEVERGTIRLPERTAVLRKARLDGAEAVIAVLRGGHALPYGQVPALQEGDRLVLITSP